MSNNITVRVCRIILSVSLLREGFKMCLPPPSKKCLPFEAKMDACRSLEPDPVTAERVTYFQQLLEVKEDDLDQQVLTYFDMPLFKMPTISMRKIPLTKYDCN